VANREKGRRWQTGRKGEGGKQGEREKVANREKGRRWQTGRKGEAGPTGRTGDEISEKLYYLILPFSLLPDSPVLPVT
jgi:hypothetical protein